MLTCRSFSQELHEHLHAFKLLADEDEKRTVTVDIILVEHGDAVEDIVWTRLPRIPSHARFLIANVRKENGY